MRCSIADYLLIATLLLAASGCSTSPPSTQPSGEYRTVTLDPRRNTEAAHNANQAGLDHLDKGQIDKAIQAFKAALTADVTFGPAHNNLGKVYYAQRDFYQAAWEFEYAIKLMPGQPEPRNNLGLVYEAVGKIDEAVNCFDEALRSAPDNPHFIGNAARARVLRGDRTNELRELLSKLILRDTRPDWVAWARRTLALMPSHASPHNSASP